jgi:hypothetical protein
MFLENSPTFSPHQQRILLGHLASFGDCLYATTIARQIKNDYPDCHLTWAIGSKYHSVIDENPYVDEKWIFPFDDITNLQSIWDMFEKELQTKTVLMGFGLDSDAIHSPNEHYGIFNYFKGIETIPQFFKHFAALNQ